MCVSMDARVCVRRDSAVIALTGADFDRRVKQQGGKWLVELYVPCLFVYAYSTRTTYTLSPLHSAFFVCLSVLFHVYSYAPWCGYCKQLAPVYEQVALQLQGKVNVAKIDASEGDGRKVGTRFGIKGFPTIKLYVVVCMCVYVCVVMLLHMWLRVFCCACCFLGTVRCSRLIFPFVYRLDLSAYFTLQHLQRHRCV